MFLRSLSVLTDFIEQGAFFLETVQACTEKPTKNFISAGSSLSLPMRKNIVYCVTELMLFTRARI